MSLLEKARAVRENAHARYSGFKVGAAVRATSGRVYVGCNVENAAYPEGTCAETGAIAAMVAAGERELTEVAIIAEGAEPISPCGGCRQRLAEFAGPDTKVIMATMDGQQRSAKLGDLLPGAFVASSIVKG
ncbi:MAG: cytidine deaminase [Pseudomonadota bacterium]|uniref:cytidine deaminase n=1 Tax=Roseovarius TaxID=74030 RepID=UPI0022A85AFE|nr:cytidine deaminase [Roseovarius sp. EGI FJ00037]MCZ0812974.1 cytidine deaminase [Roseovarius sp. EGI FJ00037]